MVNNLVNRKNRLVHNKTLTNQMYEQRNRISMNIKILSCEGGGAKRMGGSGEGRKSAREIYI